MRNWERPMAVVDAFVANEFVSACGDENKEYLFECNAGEKGSRYDVFTNDGHNLTKGRLDYYYPCGETHKAKVDSGFINGYMVANGGNDKLSYLDWDGVHQYEKTNVIIWTNNGTDVHCTTNLHMDTWKTQKS